MAPTMPHVVSKRPDLSSIQDCLGDDRMQIESSTEYGSEDNAFTGMLEDLSLMLHLYDGI